MALIMVLFDRFKKAAFMFLLVLTMFCFCSHQAQAQNCITCQRTRQAACVYAGSSPGCFCVLNSKYSCSNNGCPCSCTEVDGEPPPICTCFCPSKVGAELEAALRAGGSAEPAPPTVESVKAEWVEKFSDPEQFLPGKLIVIHTSKSGCKDQPVYILGLIQAAAATHHAIAFTTLDENEEPTELVGK